MKRDFLTYLIYIILLPALLLAILHFSRKTHESSVYTKTRLMMGTIVEISVAGYGNREDAKGAIEDAFGEIARIENKFSAYKPDSDAARINRLKAGEWMEADDETFRLIEESLRYNKLTDGAFDITVKPLVDLWGFSAHKGRVPTPDEIKDALTRVGSDKILLNKAGKKIGLAEEGVRIDLGGIAKGYATDMAAASLKRSGVKDAIVNSGGDMYCLGRKDTRRLWKVGIQHPRVKRRLIASISVEDAAVDTSGDYENFFKIGDKRFCHILDPKTGMSVGSRPSSATVIAKSSMEAQALAKVFMVLGATRGAEIVSRNFDVEWIVISEGPDGALAIQRSKGIGNYAYEEG